MTIQTKHFVEVSDIQGLRISCKHCGATIFLPFTKDFDVKKFLRCPLCREGWIIYNDGGSSIEPAVQEAVDAIRNLNRILGDHPDLGGALTLEIRYTPTPERVP